MRPLKIQKNKLIKNKKIKEGMYYIERNNRIMNDDMIIKEIVDEDNSDINIIRNDCVKISFERKDDEDEIEKIQTFILLSDFKIIKADQNKEIKVCYNDVILHLI